ncbi:MAG: FecR family protein, partial [Putridiphycobacter sp.]|nr:FecR family protein [Putridiphycobacter sp.]
LFIGLAAVLTLALIAFQFWNANKYKIELATSDQILEKVLDDGSFVTLNSHSKITYANNFGKKERKISLRGEAFFDIARDTITPFIIELPANTFVKVLGTSFSIRTNSFDSTTNVFVKSGIVEFGNAHESIILTAQEKAIYNPKTDTFEKVEKALNEEEELYWMNEQLVFEGESLEAIIKKLEYIFQTRIELNCESAVNLPIISNHQHEKLDDILMVICMVHNLELHKESVEGKDSYTISCDD